MKTLKFMPNLVPLILSGAKKCTWRLFDDKDLKKEDKLILINKETGIEFAKAVITKVKEKRLGDLNDSDYDGHERFENEEKMYETYKSYYGDKVTSDTIIKIIDFNLTKK